jgi:hypothetical protein
MDLVLVDAPCTRSGVWRDADAKWRLSDARRARPSNACSIGAVLSAGGCNVSSSVETVVDAFLARHPGFSSCRGALTSRARRSSFSKRLGPGAARPAEPRNRRLLRRSAGTGGLGPSLPTVSSCPAEVPGIHKFEPAAGNSFDDVQSPLV